MKVTINGRTLDTDRHTMRFDALASLGLFINCRSLAYRFPDGTSGTIEPGDVLGMRDGLVVALDASHT